MAGANGATTWLTFWKALAGTVCLVGLTLIGVIYTEVKGNVLARVHAMQMQHDDILKRLGHIAEEQQRRLPLITEVTSFREQIALMRQQQYERDLERYKTLIELTAQLDTLTKGQARQDGSLERLRAAILHHDRRAGGGGLGPGELP